MTFFGNVQRFRMIKVAVDTGSVGDYSRQNDQSLTCEDDQNDRNEGLFSVEIEHPLRHPSVAQGDIVCGQNDTENDIASGEVIDPCKADSPPAYRRNKYDNHAEFCYCKIFAK
jgi:hypothetical protein